MGARVRYHIYLDSHGFGAHRDVCPRRHIAGEDWGGALGLTDPWNGSVVEEGAHQRLAAARRLALDEGRDPALVLASLRLEEASALIRPSSA